MDDPAKKETMLFVALPGAEPYAELPKSEVKQQLAKGLLKQSALIWSQKHNAWRQARHITQLIALKFQPRPAQPRIAAQRKPHVVVRAPSVAKASMQPHPAAHAENATTVLMPSLKTPVWLKALCAALAVIITALLALNWYYVDHALKANLAEDQSPFREVPIYAHLGGFFQAGQMVIHLRRSKEVTADNLAPYLAALALATPNRPMSTTPFDSVSLSAGWTADYHLSGKAWSRLAKVDLTEDQLRNILLENLYLANGEKLIPATNLDAGGRFALEEKRWEQFVETFTK